VYEAEGFLVRLFGLDEGAAGDSGFAEPFAGFPEFFHLEDVLADAGVIFGVKDEYGHGDSFSERFLTNWYF
jgi:hypothetical protein